MENRRSLLHSLWAVLLMGALLIGCSVLVSAETADDFTLIPNYETGAMEIKYKDTDEHVCSLWIEGEIIVPKIGVEGNDIYFTTYSQIEGTDEANCTLRCYNTVDQEVFDLVLNLPGSYWQYQIEYIYKGGVFMSALASSDYAGSYRYDMHSGLVKKISDGAIIYHYKQFAVCDPSPVLGSFAPYTVYVYNAKKGTTKAILTDVAHVSANGKYLYLAKMNKVNYSPSSKRTSYQIVRYKLTTGASKTLVNPFKGYSISKITKKYIYYMRFVGGKDKYYQYTFKTRKKKRISFAVYKNVMTN